MIPIDLSWWEVAIYLVGAALIVCADIRSINQATKDDEGDQP